MSLQKLAKELDETATQSAGMLDDISRALDMLSQKDIARFPLTDQAVRLIILAMQRQDRIEQRCRNLAEVARQLALLSPQPSDEIHEEIWSRLSLEELRPPTATRPASHQSNADIELF